MKMHHLQYILSYNLHRQNPNQISTHLNKNNASDSGDPDMKRLRLLIKSSFVETRCKVNARSDEEPGFLGSFVSGEGGNSDMKEFIRYFSSEQKEVDYKNLNFISYKQI